MLNGTVLTKENTIKYLGAILGNNGSATHVAQRIKAASGSFFQLQAAGMYGGGLSPDAIIHDIYIYIYTLAIQPALTYGAHAIHLKKTDLQLLEKAHARIIKTSKRGDTGGKTLMGRSHTILKQYGLRKLKPYSIMFLESTTHLLYMNSTPTGKMDSLTLCVPFLMTLHSETNSMPKCCCDSNFVLLF